MDHKNRNQKFHYKSDDGSIHFHHVREERANAQEFKLHYENGYELYLFISGTGSYKIEGNSYELEPYSILMMNRNELHAIHISENHPYERMVLAINERFLPPFMVKGVDFFRTLKGRKLGQNNQITAEAVASSGLLALFTKLRQLLAPNNAEDEFVAKCVIVQMLSTLNRIAESQAEAGLTSGNSDSENKMQAILAYVNAHLDQPLPLDALSEHFFVSKSHLCHLFKAATGYTVHQYLTYKRIRLADELMLKGYPSTQACLMSGFNDYSNFFRSYRKLTGLSPKNGKPAK